MTGLVIRIVDSAWAELSVVPYNRAFSQLILRLNKNERTFDKVRGVWFVATRRLVSLLLVGRGLFVWATIEGENCQWFVNALRSRGVSQAAVGPRNVADYRSLYLLPNAPDEVVSAVASKLRFLYHPDRLDTGNADRFREVDEAYRRIQDAISRRDGP